VVEFDSSEIPDTTPTRYSFRCNNENTVPVKMSMFINIKEKVEDLTLLMKATDKDVSAIKSNYPSIPDDYLEFLKEVGSGNLGILAVYSSPMKATEVYTSASESELSSFVLFADDMQGYCYAFDKTANYRVVEIDPRGNVDYSIEHDFLEFINSFIDS
jgi:hypothetical protein